MSDNDFIVDVQDLKKNYRQGKLDVAALRGLSLSIKKGEFTAICGPSGSGKTTLLNLMGGLDRASSGLVEVAGARMDKLSERELAGWRARHVGFVFQLYNLLPVLTAERNVELPLLLTGLSAAERKRHVATALEVVGLSDRARHRPRQLSGGQEQRVGIARAIVTDPTLLLCDEPTGSLDRVSAEAVGSLLLELHGEEGSALVVVTHNEDLARGCDRVLRLEGGRLREV